MPRKILVVCTANQCRSPMAEGLIRHRLADDDRVRSVEVSSAGTWASDGYEATAHATHVMRERGIDISDHRSAELTAERVASADLILVMTAGHREAIAAEFPDAAPRTMLFSALAGGAWDVADPVGGTVEDYRATASALERLIDAGWPLIVRDDAAPPAQRAGGTGA